jgi:hypothetical protein
MSIEPETAGKLVFAALGVAAFYCVYFIQFRKTLNAVYRDRLFMLRNNLFDLMTREGVRYDHPAHVLLRNQANGLIRYADFLHPISFMMLVLSAAHTEMPTFAERFSRASEGLPKDLKNDMFSIHNKLNQEVLRFILFGTLTGWVFVLIAAIRAFIVNRFTPGQAGMTGQILRGVDGAAERFGATHLPLARV